MKPKPPPVRGEISYFHSGTLNTYGAMHQANVRNRRNKTSPQNLPEQKKNFIITSSKWVGSFFTGEWEYDFEIYNLKDGKIVTFTFSELRDVAKELNLIDSFPYFNWFSARQNTIQKWVNDQLDPSQLLLKRENTSEEVPETSADLESEKEEDTGRVGTPPTE